MKKLTTEEFIKKSQQIHGNRYEYSLVNYIGTYNKIKIICKKHGIFEQRPNDHLTNHGCSKCRYDSIAKILSKSSEIFILQSNKIHNNVYDYSLTNYINSFTKVKIVCKKHGIFEQEPHSHIKGIGCSKCQRSKGEELIEQYLKEHNINYETQKRFKDCRNKNPLPFDFYLPDHNTCIEYDGQQHFNTYLNRQNIKYIKLLNQTKINDNIKDTYCKENGILLIRIPFSIKDINVYLLNKLTSSSLPVENA